MDPWREVHGSMEGGPWNHGGGSMDPWRKVHGSMEKGSGGSMDPWKGVQGSPWIHGGGSMDPWRGVRRGPYCHLIITGKIHTNKMKKRTLFLFLWQECVLYVCVMCVVFGRGF